VKDVVIFGTGEFAQVAHVYLRDDSDRRVAAFAVHEQHLAEGEIAGLPVVPFETLERTHPPDAYAMFVAVGFSRVNEARADVFDECVGRGYELISYVSSRAMISAGVSIGRNCFVFEGNVLQPFVMLGDDVILWSGNHIGHHARIEDHVFVASHAVVSGSVTIGHHSFVGVNATFRDGVTVAPRSVIGAGAIIMKDTIEGGVYAVPGTKARDVKSWDLPGF
jgi:sugar O-acyltransferase (sialic acid O-acetyltransferase NeuD family)